MKRYILIMISLFFAIAIMAQDEEGEKKKFYEINKPSRPAFESGILIDGQTNVIPTAKNPGNDDPAPLFTN